MEPVTYEDFVMWRTHPVTQLVFFQLKDRLEANKEYLVTSAGDDQKQDLIIRGYSQAVKDLLTIEYGEVNNA